MVIMGILPLASTSSPSIFLIFLLLLLASQSNETVIGDEPRCQPIDTPFCSLKGYFTVKPFNNTLGHTSLNVAIAELHKFAYLHKREKCKNKIQLFLCSLYLPVCVTTTDRTVLETLLLPCRDDCEDARQVCRDDLAIINLSWPEEWDCRRFHYRRDDAMCVINNARESQPTSTQLPSSTAGQRPSSQQKQQLSLLSQPSNSQLTADVDMLPSKADAFSPVDSKLSPYAVTSFAHDNETICGEDMFDCKLTAKDMKSFCIARSYVCDGHKDCVLSDEIGNDLDEVGCDRKCPEGQLYCDGRCVNSICDGIVDCSDGTDEQNCYPRTDWVSIIQVLFFITALSLAVSLFIRLFVRTEKKDAETSDDEEVQIDMRYDLPKPTPEPQKCLPIDAIARATPRCPIYQEPAYSIMTRSDYERLNVGGYSGASSIYASFGPYHSLPMLDDPKEPPAAPPPTPAPQSVYSDYM